MLIISVFQLSFLAGSTGPVGAHKLLGPERPLEVSYGTMSALNPNALPPLIAEAADQKVTPECARERDGQLLHSPACQRLWYKTECLVLELGSPHTPR